MGYHYSEYRLYDFTFVRVTHLTSRLEHPRPALLATALRTFDQLSRGDAFRRSTFDCAICLSSTKGSRAVTLSCGHIFCRRCLADFWTTSLADGNVRGVVCAESSCFKEGRSVTDSEVIMVLGHGEHHQQWKSLTEKRLQKLDPFLQLCPIDLCQTMVPSPYPSHPKKGEEYGPERLRTCPKCSYSFCSICRKGW